MTTKPVKYFFKKNRKVFFRRKIRRPLSLYLLDARVDGIIALKIMYMTGKLLTFAGVLSLSILLSACFEKKGKQAEATQYNTVEVANPEVKKIEIWDSYTARIEGEKSVEIRSRVSGYLEKIYFKDGDFVKAGDILFEIDPRPFQALVEASQAEVKEIETRIELAQSNLERARNLYEVNAISKEILDTRKSELLAAQAVLSSAKAKLKEATLNLEFTKTYSPISGYISRRRVDEGNLIDASSTLMAMVVSRDTVYAYFEISERDVIKYTKNKLFDSIDTAKHTGPAVKLLLLDETEPSHFGCVTYVDNTLNASSIELRAEISNDKKQLYPGMFAKILLRAGEPVEHMLVPEAAVGTDLVGRYVMVVNDKDIAEYRAVAVGELFGNKRIILDGLKASDRVVVSGLHRATPHSKVKPVKSAESENK